MKNAKTYRRIIAASMSLCLTFGCAATAYADKSKTYGSIKKIIKLINDNELAFSGHYSSDDADSYLNENNSSGYNVGSPYIERVELPESYDLKDADGKCYVKEVRSKIPYNTCWAFAAIASSEISIATALDIDLNTATEEQKKALDLSERHLAWFAKTSIPENDPIYSDRAGEGTHLFALEDTSGMSNAEISDKVMNSAGCQFIGSYLFSAGIGSALESEIPYINDEGYYYIVAASHVDENYNLIDQEILKDGFTNVIGLFDDKQTRFS